MQSVVLLLASLIALVLFAQRKKTSTALSLSTRNLNLHNGQVFVQLDGGLCNQLFEILNGYAYSQQHGYQLIIGAKPICFRPPYWDTWCHYFSKYKAQTILPNDVKNWVVYNQPNFRYEPIPSGQQLLTGYFQSSKFFKQYKDSLNKLFFVPTHVQNQIERKHLHLLVPQILKNGIVVHIRRSDYITKPHLHGILTPKYFEYATSLCKSIVGSHAHLVVFSDDIQWCKEQDFLHGSIFVDEAYDVAALYLMSQFQNYVISNSSFSWWSVMLGQKYKTVVAPDTWFGPEGPQDFDDIYETDWIKVNVNKYK